MKKLLTIVAVIVGMLFAFLLGTNYGVKITAESAVIVEDSEYHYGISYLNNEIEVYYCK